ncbi:MAG TPA: hypothetical protein VFA26_22635 [Gemmataceae bacterium]|nr:hypothetical protein [Gemmataceae bacterium]
MEPPDRPADEDLVVQEATRAQVEHFRGVDVRCRVLQLPEGLMLRYTLSRALYFYLKTGVAEGKISTRVYASDSPYEPRKNDIGEVRTPLFEEQADRRHLQRVERLLRAWVEFVQDEPAAERPFTSFPGGGLEE